MNGINCEFCPTTNPSLLSPRLGTLAAIDVAVMWEDELSSVDATPLSFFSSSSSSHCTPLSSVWRRGELLGGGESGGGGDGKSSSSSAASFTFTTASRRRSIACGSAGKMNWKHSWKGRMESGEECREGEDVASSTSVLSINLNTSCSCYTLKSPNIPSQVHHAWFTIFSLLAFISTSGVFDNVCWIKHCAPERSCAMHFVFCGLAQKVNRSG